MYLNNQTVNLNLGPGGPWGESRPGGPTFFYKVLPIKIGNKLYEVGVTETRTRTTRMQNEPSTI